MLRSTAFTAALGLAAMLTAYAQAAEGVLTETRHVLSADLAVEAAQAAIASCKSQGWNITASIAERSGAIKILLVGDGAGGVGRESARRKAYTSALLGISTDEFAQRLKGGGFDPKVYDPQMASDGGGVPIKIGNEIIGGIGAAGAPGGDKDEGCAKAGLAKIAERLK